MTDLKSPRAPKVGDVAFDRREFEKYDGDLTAVTLMQVVRVDTRLSVTTARYLGVDFEFPHGDDNLVVLTPETVFPSTRQILQHEISVREVGGRGWAFYWMEGGAEFTFLSGGEGPYEIQHNDWQDSLDEAMEMIGGDQECVLTPASLRRFGVDVPRTSRRRRY